MPQVLEQSLFLFSWALECGTNFGMFCILALPPPLWYTSQQIQTSKASSSSSSLPEWCERRAKYIFIFLALGDE